NSNSPFHSTNQLPYLALPTYLTHQLTNIVSQNLYNPLKRSGIMDYVDSTISSHKPQLFNDYKLNKTLIHIIYLLIYEGDPQPMYFYLIPNKFQAFFHFNNDSFICFLFQCFFYCFDCLCRTNFSLLPFF